MDEQSLFKSLKQQVKEYGNTYHNFSDEDLFTLWFLRAYITEDEDVAAKAVVNGPNDKGLDAIYIDEKAHVAFLVQTKYRKQLHKASENANEVTKLADFAEIIARYDNSEFREFVEDADLIVKDKLYRVRQKVTKQDFKLWLYYVTLGKCSSKVRMQANNIVRHSEYDISLEIIDGKRSMLLYHDFLDGVAPPIPTLDLEMESGSGVSVNGVMQRYEKQGEIESWVFPMRGSDIGNLYEASGIRLFARNIRGFLGKSTKVNVSMQETLEEEPEKFFYYNNGVTIVCDKAERISRKGRDILKVNNPQIINGQQTTRTLSAFPTKARKASVLVKVIQVPRNISDKSNGFDVLVSAIVQGTNWQNPVKQSDLIVNDRKQIEIEREFRKLGYLYLRKRQSKSEAKRAVGSKFLRVITKEELARAVAGCEEDPLVLRKGLENLFSEDKYLDVFPNTDPFYYLPRYWLWYHVSRCSRNHTDGGYSKWLVLNFAWSQIQKFVQTNKGSVSFRKKCETRNGEFINNLQKAINAVFRGAKKYHSKNRGQMDVRDFYKSRKGRDKEFQKFWNTSDNKQGKVLETTLNKLKIIISEG